MRFVLLHEYDSNDLEFLRGAEVGYLEAKLELLGSSDVHEIMRRSNEAIVRRIAAGVGRNVS